MPVVILAACGIEYTVQLIFILMILVISPTCWLMIMLGTLAHYICRENVGVGGRLEVIFILAAECKGSGIKIVFIKSWLDVVVVVVVVVEGCRGVLAMKGLGVRFVDVSMVLFGNKNVKKSYP
jgi:hypothetical protein